MKLIKLTLLLALVAALSFATTGCKKGPKNTTPLPGSRAGGPGGGDTALPPGNTFDPNSVSGVDSATGGIPQDGSWSVDQFNQDAAALAAFTVYFAFDSDAVRSGEASKVSSVASALAVDASARLLIEGHCDERGTEEYNRSLGERRALALRAELAKQGIDPNRVKTISYGEDKPASAGHDESAWSQNRRGVFILLHPK
jgi:peptidoglycan-associated lipoprotein